MIGRFIRFCTAKLGRVLAFCQTNHEGIGAAAAGIQAIAVVAAGVWFGWVFYYSEKVKPTLPETFLNPQVRLAIAGAEKDERGNEFFVVRLDMEMENKSGQTLDLPSSIALVTADRVSSDPPAFAASDVQTSLNKERGARARYRGSVEQTKFVYVANEYSRWTVGVGERALHSRLFRVPVGQFDQLEANWYTLSGPNLGSPDIAHVVAASEKYDYIVTSCVCKGSCPKPPKIAASAPDKQECEPPWHELESEGAKKIFGFENKTGMSTATTFLVLPRKQVAAK